jgi:hypothetical protein
MPGSEHTDSEADADDTEGHRYRGLVGEADADDTDDDVQGHTIAPRRRFAR